MNKTIETPSEVGLVFGGGTIFAGINAEGFRNATESVDLVGVVKKDLPGLKVKISRPAVVAYTGLSENIDLPTLKDMKSACVEVLKRPPVRSLGVTMGSDFPEVAGSYLDQDEEIKQLLEEKEGTIEITFSNDPYPAQEAKRNLEKILTEADRKDKKPGVYITTEHGSIPIEGARKETYCGRPMRFYDWNDPEQRAEEGKRRFKIFVTANELAKMLGRSGAFEMIGLSLPYPGTHPEHKGQWVATEPGPYKTAKLIRSPQETPEITAYQAAVLSHAVHRDLNPPFPKDQGRIWPVNLPTDPAKVESVIQGFFPSVKAFLLILNHSSTAHTKRPELSIAQTISRLRQERNIVTFAVTENGEPTNFGEGSYVTSKDLRNSGVVPLPMHSKVAWVKLWAGLDNGLSGVRLVDFMTTKVHPDEFTGKLDEQGVSYARDLIEGTPIRPLRRPGYGTGYLVLPNS